MVRVKRNPHLSREVAGFALKTMSILSKLAIVHAI